MPLAERACLSAGLLDEHRAGLRAVTKFGGCLLAAVSQADESATLRYVM